MPTRTDDGIINTVSSAAWNSFLNQLAAETQQCSAASSDRHWNFDVQFFAMRDEGKVGHASFAAPNSPPPGLLHSSAVAASTKKTRCLRSASLSSWCQHHDKQPTAARSDGPAQPSKGPPLRATRLEQQSIAVSVPAATHRGAQQNGAPQSQQNCHQSPTHTDRRRSTDADGWAPRVRCRERHGHVDAERALQATVTGQGAGLPQQRDQEVVDVPQPQIAEFSERHSPERMDEQLLTVALV